MKNNNAYKSVFARSTQNMVSTPRDEQIMSDDFVILGKLSSFLWKNGIVFASQTINEDNDHFDMSTRNVHWLGYLISKIGRRQSN